MVGDTVVKTIKQYSEPIENIEELQHIGELYTTVKNYVYSRFSGVNSILKLNKHRKEIRDTWVKSNFAAQWKLPARYWKMALEEAIGNIKSEWSNTKNRVKGAVLKNSNITNDEKMFICYILKADKFLHNILTYKPFEIHDKIEKLKIRKQYIYNLIRRYIRKYKGKIAYSHNTRSFMIDEDMYNYSLNENKLTLNIMGFNRGKRINVVLKDHNFHKGNLRIVLKGNSTMEVHKAKNTTVKVLNTEERVIGIDKGYRTLIAVSENKFYGKKLNDILSKETERLNEVNKKRNVIWVQIEKYKENGNIRKAETIIKNNFGNKKYNRNKNRHDSFVKSYINRELNHMLKDIKPTEIVLEDLSFVNWNDKFPKHIRRKLSRWIKGYIEERIEYKCSLNKIVITKVNAAYTSQFCSKCGSFGKRTNETFTCPNCGNIDADYNGSVNIKNRKDDKEINIYTPHKEVKEILLKR